MKRASLMPDNLEEYIRKKWDDLKSMAPDEAAKKISAYNKRISQRKQLIFDLDTKVLEQILGPGYRRIYDDIRKFLRTKKIEHIEGSGYSSMKPMSLVQFDHTIDELLKKYPYLTKAVKRAHEASIGSRHSLDYKFDYDGTAGEYKGYKNP